MTLLRLILAAILSLAIPVTGFAAVPASPCPMQMPYEPPGASMATPHCCDHDDTASGHGKSCEPDQHCSACGLFFALPATLQFVAAVGRIVLPTYVSPSLSGQTAVIWHPPRLS